MHFMQNPVFSYMLTNIHTKLPDNKSGSSLISTKFQELTTFLSFVLINFNQCLPDSKINGINLIFHRKCEIIENIIFHKKN